MIKWIERRYGKMQVSRGKIHNYLGMVLDYSSSGEVKVNIIKYIKDTIEGFIELISGGAATPAASHLFEVNEDGVKLVEQLAQVLHTTTAKLLFLWKRAQPDIQVPIAFLTTRVKHPDEDDWKKLVRVLKYLKDTVDIVLTLSADNMSVVKWWVDGSYGVHNDFKSHTGGCMSLGKGTVYSTSIKQKINTKSSTEAEVMSVADVLPQILWIGYF